MESLDTVIKSEYAYNSMVNGKKMAVYCRKVTKYIYEEDCCRCPK